LRDGLPEERPALDDLIVKHADKTVKLPVVKPEK
jgi:hypothetical protein